MCLFQLKSPRGTHQWLSSLSRSSNSTDSLSSPHVWEAPAPSHVPSQRHVQGTKASQKKQPTGWGVDQGIRRGLPRKSLWEAKQPGGCWAQGWTAWVQIPAPLALQPWSSNLTSLRLTFHTVKLVRGTADPWTAQVYLHADCFPSAL